MVTTLPMAKLFVPLFVIWAIDVWLASCELIPQFVDPSTGTVYQLNTDKRLKVTIEKDVQQVSNSQRSKTVNSGLNVGLTGKLLNLGFNRNSHKVHVQNNEYKSSVKVDISLPEQCSDGCLNIAHDALAMAGKALEGEPKKQIP